MSSSYRYYSVIMGLKLIIIYFRVCSKLGVESNIVYANDAQLGSNMADNGCRIS